MAVTFYTLTVAQVEPITDSSVAVTFNVPDDLVETFAHEPGQHVIVKATIDGEGVRRSYSICSPSGSRDLTIGVKHLDGGIFSTYVNSVLSAGDTVEVTAPTGDFTITTDPEHEDHYIAIVAGSGITPVLSMISSVLACEPASRFTLIYGNRDGRSIMFLDELDALKNQYPERFVMFHILSRESQAIEMFEGRIDEQKLVQLFSTVVDAGTATEWYLCGPAGMVRAASTVLTAGGVPEGNIHDELFFAGDDSSFVAVSDDAYGSEVKFTLNGRTSTIIVDPAGAPILDHALTVRPDAPFSCRSGACASCRARVTVGEVVMDRNWSLNQEEVDAGQVLTCQSHPISEVVELTFDLWAG
jgi:ring-1,2-phenylacetyl-CoA epoxidase subunit PaaE